MQGIDTKTAKKHAERETEREITVWHCRNCAEHGCGCCGAGDISFNVTADTVDMAEDVNNLHGKFKEYQKQFNIDDVKKETEI